MKIAGVTVLYNPDKKVLDNIATYLDNIDRLYVVDNSECDNLELFNDKRIKYIANKQNLGIAKALNIGAREAIKDKFKWLLTMDQDSSFEKNDVDQMKEFLEKIRTDSYLQKVIATNYEEIGLISPYHITVMNDNNSFVGVDSPMFVMTSGNIINLSAYQKIDGFKDWLFIDDVDLEYCLNLRRNNYKIFRLNYIKMHHNLGDSVIKMIGKKRVYSLNHSYIRRYYIVRNRHYIYDLYKDIYKDFCKLELSRTRREAIKIILCEKQKLKKLYYMFLGYIDYKKGVKYEKK